MSFILQDLVSEIYDAYEALPNGRQPLSRDEKSLPLFGNLEIARNAECGKTVWMIQGGSFGSPLLAATEEKPSSYDALVRFLVWMWVEDLQTGWEKMVDLIAAIRQTVYGPNLGALGFTIPTELEGREMHHGELYLLDITLSVPIPINGTVEPTRVPLESHEGAINTGASSLTDFTAFDTVVVTGPPTP